MDPRLAVSVVIVLAVTVVKARSPAEIPPNVMCRDDCLFGYKPGYTCQCRTLGDLLFKPCDLKKCAETARCVERDRRAVCVSTITSYPSFPISPIRVCSLPKVVGPCEAAMARFYYNGAFNRCEEFTFGGCQGNGNNFMTMEECSLRCERRRSFY